MRERRKHIAGVPLLETGARGNRHFNPRRPDGPVCPECGAPWKPICPTRSCPGGRIPAAIIRSEKQDADTKRYGARWGEKKGRDVAAPPERKPLVHATETLAKPTSELDAKLRKLEAKYGGRRERRRRAA